MIFELAFLTISMTVFEIPLDGMSQLQWHRFNGLAK